MSRIKTIAVVILISSLVLAAFLWVQSQPKPEPRFEIVDLDLTEVPAPYQDPNYLVTFKIKNNGTGGATNVHGTIKFKDGRNKTWRLFIDEEVLKAGETSSILPIYLDDRPISPLVTIAVECNEGVTQHFNESLPP